MAVTLSTTAEVKLCGKVFILWYFYFTVENCNSSDAAKLCLHKSCFDLILYINAHQQSSLDIPGITGLL